MRKVIVFLVMILLVIPAHALANEESVPSGEIFPLQVDVNGDKTAEFVIFVDGLPPDVSITEETEEYEHVTYTHYLFAAEKDIFQFTMMRTKDHDVMFFAKQFPGNEQVNVQLTIQAKENLLEHRYVQPVDNETFLGDWLVWQSLTDVDTMPLRPVYVKGTRLHARIGVVDVFTPQGYDVYKREASLPAMRIAQDRQTSYRLSLYSGEESFSYTWGILSSNPLVNWEIPYAANLAKKIDMDTFRKIFLEGLYDITPHNYEPASEVSYYRNPANVTGLHHVFDIPQRQFGSLSKIVLSHLAYAALDQQNEQGYWPTRPRSNWLFNDYQIGYDYFDNRRNADNATFLLRFNKQFPEPLIEQALQRWDDFLYRYMETTSLRTANQGYLLPDYLDKDMQFVSHTALNHHIAIANYLLESNLYQPEQWKQQAAQRLLQGVEDTWPLWIKPNSDLYYALYRNLKPHPYPDYYSLTLEDMLLTSSLLRQNQMRESLGINHLIAAKQAWIEAQRMAASGVQTQPNSP